MESYARQTEDGGAELGVIVDGAYVPLARADGWRVEQLRENAENRGDVKKKERSSARTSKAKAQTSDSESEG